MPIPRRRGVLGGLLLVLLGLWAALIPFVGPYFNFEFVSDKAWDWTSDRFWLSVLPGAVIALGGLPGAAGAPTGLPDGLNRRLDDRPQRGLGQGLGLQAWLGVRGPVLVGAPLPGVDLREDAVGTEHPRDRLGHSPRHQ